MKKCSNQSCLWDWPDETDICSVCGGDTFIDPTSTPLSRPTRLPSCCINPVCAKSIIFTDAKYCSECGTKLEPVSHKAWKQKILAPAINSSLVQTVIDPSGLLSTAPKFGSNEDAAKESLDEALEQLTNVRRQILLSWIQNSLLVAEQAEDNQTARESALRAAKENNISEEYARRVIDELIEVTTIADTLSERETAAIGDVQTDDDSRRDSSAMAPTSSVSSVSENVTLHSAKSFYLHLVSGGAVSNNLVYLSPEMSVSKTGLKDRAEVLREVQSKLGSFVLFVDGDKGWVFPNPSLPFRPKAFASIFPALTAEQYKNSKTEILPIEVVRAGKGLWKVSTNRTRSTFSGATEPLTIDPGLKTTNPHEPSPISAANYLDKTRRFARVLRPDFQKGFLVSDPTGKGELVLIQNSSQSAEMQAAFLIPRMTHFYTKQEFYTFYERYYQCQSPSAGDIWIINPAVVDAVKGGWKLKSRGVLEVREAPAQPEPRTARQPDPQDLSPSTSAEYRARAESPVIQPAVKPSSETRNLKRKNGTSILIGAGIVAVGVTVVAVITWRISASLRSPKDESMVHVEGTNFLMGRSDGEENERPQHKVTVGPFSIDKYEVTREEYEKFVKATRQPFPSGWTNGHFPVNTGRWPATGLDWYAAAAYCKWTGKRLPTEEEWELAARGFDGRKYPWGNEWQAGSANAENAASGLAEVDRFNGASPYGAIGMVGNAWEWTSSKLAPYPGGRLPPDELGDGQVDLRVIRGGSWQSKQTSATTTYRWGWPASGGSDYANTGFRCVKDP